MVLKIVKMKTSKKIPFKTKNAKIINFYTGNILEDSRTVDLGMFIKIKVWFSNMKKLLEKM